MSALGCVRYAGLGLSNKDQVKGTFIRRCRVTDRTYALALAQPLIRMSGKRSIAGRSVSDSCFPLRHVPS